MRIVARGMCAGIASRHGIGYLVATTKYFGANTPLFDGPLRPLGSGVWHLRAHSGGEQVEPEVIRVVKALKNVTTAELARRAGVEHTTAWRWETGKPNVSAETSEKLQRALLAGVRDVPARKSA